MKKAERNKAIRDRANDAVSSLYHNATIKFPNFRNDYESEIFWSWLSDTASFKIAELNHIEKKKLKSNRLVERAKYGPYETISHDYGKIYQWGRGGRTLAPKDLIKQRGGSSFSVLEDFFNDKTIEEATKAIAMIESFNATVKSWCDSIPEQWKDFKKDNGLNRVIWRYDNKTKYQKIAWR